MFAGTLMAVTPTARACLPEPRNLATCTTRLLLFCHESFVSCASSCDTLGPLNIGALEMLLGFAGPCLMDLFIPKI
jgi:hypothetical protein